MPPTLSDASFPKLHTSPNKASAGTVTGPDLDRHLVVINSKNTKHTWVGVVLGPTGTANVWKAAVRRLKGRQDVKDTRETDEIAVTVTNPPTAEESDEIARQTDVVP